MSSQKLTIDCSNENPGLWWVEWSGATRPGFITWLKEPMDADTVVITLSKASVIEGVTVIKSHKAAQVLAARTTKRE